MSVIAIDVDAQCTFTPLCPHELPVVDGDKIVDELNQQALLADFRVLTKDAHNPNSLWVASETTPALSPLPYPNADLSWPRHAEVGSFGFEALPGLPRPIDYDFLIYKGVENDLHPYGACYHDLNDKISTGLIEWLQAKGATQIIVGGLATDFCVKTTVLQLLKADDWQVIVNLAACRGIAPDSIQSAKEQMQQAGAVLVSDSQDIASLLPQ